MNKVPAFERLMSAVSPHGIDLVQVAIEAHQGLPINATRRRQLLAICAGISEDELRGQTPDYTARGKQTRIVRPISDLKPALAGLKGPPLLAAYHSFLLDSHVHAQLHWALLEAAGRLGRVERWALLIQRGSGHKEPWAQQLCELLLMWDWFKDLFILTPSLYWHSLDVSEEIWRSKLLSPFTGLRLEYDGWLGRARRYVERAIYGEFHRYDLDAA